MSPGRLTYVQFTSYLQMVPIFMLCLERKKTAIYEILSTQIEKVASIKVALINIVKPSFFDLFVKI